MKPKVLVTREVFSETLAYLNSHFDIESNQEDHILEPDALIERARDKDGIICCLTDLIDERLLAHCPRLKIVANIAVGYNNIDLAACSARSVMVTNTPGVLDESTADLAWALMLSAARRVTEAQSYVDAGLWKGWHMKQLLGVDIHHATLGIFGMGRIGQAIARRALGFSMRVIYHNRTRVDAEIERRLNAVYTSKDELLAQADFVVLQLPYTPQTHHFIGAMELDKMKASAILVNSTRGGLVDDAALIAALKAGTIRAAGLDVFENEPQINTGFLELKNVVLLPHIGSSTEVTRRAMAMLAARNAVAGLSGAIPPNLLNPNLFG